MGPKDTSSAAHSRFGTLARETIQQILDSRGWSQADAIRAWGIAGATLSDVLSGKIAAGAASLSPILEAEKWDPVTFFLHHPRIQMRHLEVGDSPLDGQFDRFVRAAGSEERVERALNMVERLEKLKLRDEIGTLVSLLLMILEKATKAPRAR